MMKRQIENILYKWLFVALILCGSSHTVSITYAYTQTAQPATWGYRPVNTAMPTYNSIATKGGVYNNAYTPKFSSDVCPSYQFQSTSPYSSTISGMNQNAGFNRGLRRTSPWDDDDDDDDDDPVDNPIGQIDDPAPIGEPFVLIVMALLYLCAMALRHSRKETMRRSR